MKKKYIVFGLVIIVALLAAATTPKKDDFTRWIKTQVKKEADNVIVSWGIDFLGDKLDGLIQSTTTCSNYVVFTVCETKFTDKNKIKALGVFNNFLSLH
ncbi:DUF4359 domain-containing protein [Paenibacillus sp. J2TS4]|uniref:DUF4359 domain-containing protein n=1 Tax=Paenibacillus sp. J2TS4 TaxID=2807194 RepID=UPI001B18DD80|nr:DUF4359 domain-containing protein [Paenibacillus sp. J2TS4]GIP34184.1 hypothetical protein J2TS4_33940 [Paenibacillus sp. J2TS4]